MEELISGLSSDDADTRLEAVFELGETEDPKAVPYLIGALDDSDFYVQVQAIQGLRDIPDSASVGPLCKLVENADPHPTIVSNVCVALGEIGSAEALPTLVKLLSDSKPFTRYDAALALGEIGDASAVPALTKLFDDDAMPEREDEDGDFVDTLDSVGEQAKRAVAMIEGK